MLSLFAKKILLCSSRMSMIRHKSSSYKCESVKAVKWVCHTPMANECDLTGLYWYARSLLVSFCSASVISCLETNVIQRLQDDNIIHKLHVSDGSIRPEGCVYYTRVQTQVQLNSSHKVSMWVKSIRVTIRVGGDHTRGKSGLEPSCKRATKQS